ncbi:hypothetical protein [Shinella sp.]
MSEIRARLLETLKTVAVALGDDLRKRLVFVGDAPPHCSSPTR